MKRLKLSVCCLLLVPLLGSWKESETISARLYSFLDYYELPNTTDKKSGSGHSFVEIFNNTSDAIQVGYYTLPSKETVTVGLWNSGVGGGSSSGSSGSSSATNAYLGVYYNREEYFYNNVQMMCSACQYEVIINKSDLDNVTKILKEKNDTYNLLTYNCANLSTEIWNTLAGTSWWTGWNRSPRFVILDIKGAYLDYIESNYVDSSDWYGHYDTKINMWSKYSK